MSKGRPLSGQDTRHLLQAIAECAVDYGVARIGDIQADLDRMGLDPAAVWALESAGLILHGPEAGHLRLTARGRGLAAN